MLSFLQFILLIGVILALAYYRVSRVLWTAAVAATLFAITVFGTWSWWCLALWWLLFLVPALIFNLPTVRKRFVSQPVLSFLRKVLPPMSPTEKIAIEAGDVWWDGELFSGRPQWKELLKLPKPALNQEEQAFIDNQVETLCGMIDDWKIKHEDSDLPEEVWDYLKKEGFFGLVIDKKYGGQGFSALAHSTIIQKIATRSVSTAVDAMVPNSLGPAELLHHYGTEEQKEYYLPRLAIGQEIPCFALTANDAGSDAGSLSDEGIVCMGEYEGEQVLGIRLTWDKRYITLAPIATVLGLAVRLYDPEHLLSEQEDVGITLCLIPTSHPGVETGRRHLPMNLGFMNGPTSGKDVFVPIEWIIGGREMAGQGWRMLMECLSVGRSVSLPSLSSALVKLSYRMTGAYARIRRQFGLPIGYFEGVQESMARMAGYTYMVESIRLMTAQAVSSGHNPAVVSAIAKYHCTEMSRHVMNDALDVHAGRGVQMGPRNYLACGYLGVPVSITVEGANILTRNLIIFGQGAIRCHPYLLKEMEIAHLNDKKIQLQQFDKVLTSHIGFAVSNFARTFVMGLSAGRLAQSPVSGITAKYFRQLNRMSSALALTADAAMLLLGGELKRKECLSARLGDVLSHLYIASAVLKYYEDNGRNSQDLSYVEWSVKTCLQQSQDAFYDFFANFPNRIIAGVLRRTIFPFGRAYKKPSDKLGSQLAKNMMQPSDFRDRLTKDCYLGQGADDITGRMENALQKYLATEPILKKVQQGVKDGVVSRHKVFAERINMAADAGLITPEEQAQLQEAETARVDALKVDDFSQDYIQKN